MNITYYGHSFVEIETGKARIYIDPFITGNTHITRLLEYFTERKPTHIILSHGHSDHLGNTQDITKVCNSQVISSAEVVQYLQKKLGITNVYSMATWGTHNFGDFSVKLVQAVHWDGFWDEEGFSGAASGIIVRAEDKNVYHAGDTALTYDMKLLGEYDSIDLAFLPIGDNYSMGIDDAVIATGFIKPKKVVPIHYDTFYSIHTDVSTFMAKVGDVWLYMKPGDEITL